ncbi:MAG: IspD/TarI family cytidylyltransferase [Coriobacteriia bacterium]|nr:IspD/TarI family cytidylyltransferase [Coriobacteriia bacterium]
MSVGMIILAGGVGSRMGKASPKQFHLLGGKPIIIHTLDKVAKLSSVDEVVITCPAAHITEMESLLANHRFERQFECIEGGETRQASVYEGLKRLRAHDTVVIHEAVRPFVTAEDFIALIDSPHANAIYGIEIPFTVLKGSSVVEGTLLRRELVNVQLPQKFQTVTLIAAHEAAMAAGADSTEDASLLFDHCGTDIAILPGSEYNIKITHPVDIIIGETIYEQYILGKAPRS